METLIVHIKENNEVETIKSLISKIKGVELIENIYKSFTKGLYVSGDDPRDFVEINPNSTIEAILEEVKTLRKTWKRK